MIGYRKKFVFVHIPKNAGQSVTSVLWPAALGRHQIALQWSARRILRKSKYDLYRIKPDHSTAREIRDVLGPDRFAEFYSFGFVRNPWDRMLSLYKFEKLRPKRSLYEIATSRDLTGFLEHLSERGIIRSQSHYITDEGGKLMVDFVGRLENLPDDFAVVCETLGI